MSAAVDTPRKRLASACTQARASHCEGLLITEGLQPWASALKAANLLSATEFSKQAGALEAASTDDFLAAGVPDRARDAAFGLLEKIVDSADAAEGGRTIPADGAGLVAEFREVARALAGHENAVRTITRELAQEHAKLQATGALGQAPGGVPPSGSGGGGGAPPPAPMPTLMERQHVAYAYQNNGEALSAAMRPTEAKVVAISTALGQDPTSLPDLGEVDSMFALAPGELPQRGRILGAFDEALDAAVYASCSVIGLDHLTHMVGNAALDKISAVIGGAPALVGGKQSVANELKRAVRATVESNAQTVSKVQARKLCARVWARMQVTIRKQGSCNAAFLDGMAASGEVPPDDPVAKTKPKSGEAGPSQRPSRATTRASRSQKRARESSSSSGSETGSTDGDDDDSSGDDRYVHSPGTPSSVPPGRRTPLGEAPSPLPGVLLASGESDVFDPSDHALM
jgi:hypothetical protein